MGQNRVRENWQELGRQLAERRRELGFGDFRDRARFVREKAGGRLSYRTIQRLENGELGSYPAETLRAVAEIYAVTAESVRAVIGGTGDLAAAGVPPAPAGPGPGGTALPGIGEEAELAAYAAQVVGEYPDFADLVETLMSEAALTTADKAGLLAMARALRQARGDVAGRTA